MGHCELELPPSLLTQFVRGFKVHGRCDFDATFRALSPATLGVGELDHLVGGFQRVAHGLRDEGPFARLRNLTHDRALVTNLGFVRNREANGVGRGRTRGARRQVRTCCWSRMSVRL